ncbi:MAG: hypothetical protein CSB55_03500 [Candidatus Cloacimonadota bacterium]|nr:MAG: hypothetical protein CSB55_03500 [Candidatus Cloacimonadota bacterium]
MKKIMILGAGFYYIDIIKNLKRNGYYVIVSDKNPDAPGFEFADEYAVIDIVDKEALYNYAKELKIDGIMAVNDFGTRSAFYVSQKLGLTNPSYLSGICGNDKGLMRDVWSHEGLPQPEYFIFSGLNDVELIKKKLNFPVVVKPVDAGGGGRGISVAFNEDELIESIEHASAYVKNGRYIAEEFMDGTEVTVDSLVFQGKVYPLAISDKEKPESKYFVATSLNFPAKFSAEIIEKIENTVIRATESLGVINGASHAELIVKGSEIRLVEMGIRCGGGHLFHTIIEENSGINAPKELAEILCGGKPNLVKKQNLGVCYRFFNPSRTGIIKSIEYDENLVKSDFVSAFGITAEVGDEFTGLIDSMKRVGFVVTKGRNREEAVKNADLIESCIKFEFE